MKQNQKGFTLIELLVVVAVIGLLASIVVISLNGARQKARDAKRVADMKSVQAALELYASDVGTYPTAATTAATLTANKWTTAFPSTTELNSTYIAGLPVAPTAESTCTTTYKYVTNTAKSAYYLEFCLGAATGTFAAGNNYIGSTGTSSGATPPTLP